MPKSEDSFHKFLPLLFYVGHHRESNRTLSLLSDYEFRVNDR